MKFTVLLLYPEWVSPLQESYMAHVEAQDADEAVAFARDEIAQINNLDMTDSDPFLVLAVYAGHHDDIKPEQDYD